MTGTDEPNDCLFGPLLSPFHDGELSAGRTREVADHVRTCPACAEELAGLRRLSGTFAAAARPTLAADRLAEMRAELAREVRKVGSPDRQPAPADEPAADPDDAGAGDARHVRFVRRLSAVAAAVFLVAAGRLVYQNYQHPSAPHDGVPGLRQPAVDPTRGKPQTLPGSGDARPAEFNSNDLPR